MRRAAATFTLVALIALLGCHKSDEPAKGEATKGGSPEATPSLPTAVRVAAVEKATLPLSVSGPGKTAAMAQQKVRAPFAGTLLELAVLDGDAVHRGQTLGIVVARESEAALSGAREMLRHASTDAERRDAERAIQLAEKNLVRKPVTASWDGSVLSHSANAGDRLSEDQEILTINDAGSTAFLADVPQSDLSRVRAGQQVTIELAGGRAPVAGAVHAVLPGANPNDFTGQVRVDLRGAAGNVPIGLFGTARILVGERRDVSVVPNAAVLKDDVSGVSRVCVVVDGKAHWIDVTPGAKDSGRTEIAAPPLAEKQTVIVSGLVGLPEGKAVTVESK